MNQTIGSRRANGDYSIRRKPNGTVEVRFYVDGVRRSVTGPNEPAAIRKAKAAEKRLFEGGPAHDDRRALGDWLDS